MKINSNLVILIVYQKHFIKRKLETITKSKLLLSIKYVVTLYVILVINEYI